MFANIRMVTMTIKANAKRIQNKICFCLYRLASATCEASSLR